MKILTELSPFATNASKRFSFPQQIKLQKKNFLNMKYSPISTLFPFRLYSASIVVAASMLLAGYSHAAVTISAFDDVPGAAPGATVPRTLSSSNGTSISATNTLPNLSYTLSNVNLASVGGVTNHTIKFDVIFSTTIGNPAYSAFGNISDSATPNTQYISNGGNLTGIFSLTSVSDGFDPSKISLKFTGMDIGSFGGSDAATITTDSGSFVAPSRDFGFSPSDFFTLTPTNGQINLRRFNMTITAVPETSSAIAGLLIFSGLIFNRRRA